jgi:hypothetical protein
MKDADGYGIHLKDKIKELSEGGDVSQEELKNGARKKTQLSPKEIRTFFS